MNDLSLFLEFIFWVVLRSGLIIVGAWLLIDIYDIIDELEEEAHNRTQANRDHKLSEH
ncbi:MAG: hypothetical protein SO119_08100 [Phascolarctobacterium sp.]|nr:hypothetical protein [Phascolarctobacterium sp.]